MHLMVGMYLSWSKMGSYSGLRYFGVSNAMWSHNDCVLVAISPCARLDSQFSRKVPNRQLQCGVADDKRGKGRTPVSDSA